MGREASGPAKTGGPVRWRFPPVAALLRSSERSHAASAARTRSVVPPAAMLRRTRVHLLARRVALRGHVRHSATAPAPPLAAQTSEFLYELPPELIAVHPAEPRGSSRLLVHVPAHPSAEHFAREVASSAAAAAPVSELPQGGAAYDLTFAALPTVLPPSSLSKLATWWRRGSAARPPRAEPLGSGPLHARERRGWAAVVHRCG